MIPRVILVRAVNVGGTARLPMESFRALLDGLGAKNARTYIASGNAVVDLPDSWTATEWADFDRTVEGEINARFGFQRDVISRSVSEVETALAEHPFEIDNPAKSYVMFLAAVPENSGAERASEMDRQESEWALVGPHLHFRNPNSASASTLNTEALLRRLGVVGTARNLRTVQAIIDLARR